MPYTIQPKNVARGRPRDKRHMRAVNAAFDDETLLQIRRMAVRDRTSLSEALRVLVEMGLETLAAER